MYLICLSGNMRVSSVASKGRYLMEIYVYFYKIRNMWTSSWLLMHRVSFWSISECLNLCNTCVWVPQLSWVWKYGNQNHTVPAGKGSKDAGKLKTALSQNDSKVPSQTNSNDIVVNKTKCIWIDNVLKTVVNSCLFVHVSIWGVAGCVCFARLTDTDRHSLFRNRGSPDIAYMNLSVSRSTGGKKYTKQYLKTFILSFNKARLSCIKHQPIMIWVQISLCNMWSWAVISYS